MISTTSEQPRRATDGIGPRPSGMGRSNRLAGRRAARPLTVAAARPDAEGALFASGRRVGEIRAQPTVYRKSPNTVPELTDSRSANTQPRSLPGRQAPPGQSCGRLKNPDRARYATLRPAFRR